MSLPTRSTTFGKITYEGETSKMLSVPFATKQLKQLEVYKEKHQCGSSSASWKFNSFVWEIRGKKLYLVDIALGLCPETQHNRVEEIFGSQEVFAKWVNKPVKAVVRVIDEHMETETSKVTTREVLIFTFKRGVVQNVERVIETFSMRVLKNYIEE